jgi:hypothetical protein
VLSRPQGFFALENRYLVSGDTVLVGWHFHPKLLRQGRCQRVSLRFEAYAADL